MRTCVGIDISAPGRRIKQETGFEGAGSFNWHRFFALLDRVGGVWRHNSRKSVLRNAFYCTLI